MNEQETNAQQNVDLGPPPVEESHLKGTPHHLEAQMANLDPKLREMFEKALADKHNMERNFKTADEVRRKTEAKLNELLQKDQEAERKRLEEQGEFKKIAEQAEARVRELEGMMAQQSIQSNLDRELMNAGAVDSDLLATALQAKHSEELKADPSRATEFVAKLRAEKPALFKSEVMPTASATHQTTPAPVKPTGQAIPNPQTGLTASSFDARDKNISIEEIERRWSEDVAKPLGPNIRKS